jgi:hypothetical protein
MRSALRSVIVAAALALSWPAYAARITVEPSFGLTLSIRGEIAAGDGAVARALIGTKRITRSRIGLHQVRRGDAPDPESTATMAELMRLRGLPEAWIGRMKAATPDGMAFITIDELRDGLPAMVLEFSQL